MKYEQTHKGKKIEIVTMQNKKGKWGHRTRLQLDEHDSRDVDTFPEQEFQTEEEARDAGLILAKHLIDRSPLAG